MTSSKPVIYVRDKVYVPMSSVVSKERAKGKYTKRLYEERACAKCEYREERHGHMCNTCSNYKGTIRLYSTKMLHGQNYLALPLGDKRHIESATGAYFEDHRIKDLRVSVPFDYKIKFLIELRDYQKTLVADFLQHKYGLIEAPPRTGKTVCMVYLSIVLGQKTLLIADQTEFLEQFLMHLEGNEDEGIPKCTNMPELEEKTGKKLYGFPKTDADFKNFQFFVMTYQQFIDEYRGKDRLRRISKFVGTLMVDEAHSAAAKCFSTVIGKFKTRYRFGVTGTVDRKDGLQWVIKKVLGPITAHTEVESMTPKVFIHDTGISIRNPPAHPTFAFQRLAKSKPRNAMLVKQVLADIKAGYSVIIPLMFKKHMAELAFEINAAADEEVARVFHGASTVRDKAERKKILQDAKSGKLKCVIGTRRLMQRGLNVPLWSAHYIAMPISNKPNLKQETSRIRTPKDGKLQPIIRLYYETALGLSYGCARNSADHMKSFGYEFSKDKETRAALSDFADSRRGRHEQNDDAEYAPTKSLFNDEPSGDDPLSKAGRAMRLRDRRK